MCSYIKEKKGKIYEVLDNNTYIKKSKSLHRISMKVQSPIYQRNKTNYRRIIRSHIYMVLERLVKGQLPLKRQSSDIDNVRHDVNGKNIKYSYRRRV